MNWFFSAFSLILLLMSSCQTDQSDESIQRKNRFAAGHPHLQFLGKHTLTSDSAYEFAWTASQVSGRFRGKSITIFLSATAHNPAVGGPIFRVQVDDQSPRIWQPSEDPSQGLVIDSLPEAEHRFRLFLLTEASVGTCQFRGVELPSGGELLPWDQAKPLQIESIGNSITCGYGNLGSHESCDFSPETEDGYQAYSAIAARELNADYQAVCYSGRGVCWNYQRAIPETMADLYDRVSPDDPSLVWEAGPWSPDIVTINLGTNDFAHEIPPRAMFVERYLELITKVRRYYPEAHIVLLTGSMMTGQRLRVLQGYLDEVVNQTPGPVHRFDLTPQGALGYGCNWHPNIAQHQLNGQELADFLRQILKP
ncbi:GDSL-type esterase/lipase family protein [Pontibacter sp. G13]|uniref:SGNH/GDSL hydrolase family protein n=1 Tax=Pontibacter sp. G13 TaxID=3074898 RepID=UPI00288AB294|nr:GDSL-type esterase/lipase family protein [Pontibacter sp. G13]WNJ20797.1 GDSL-type esterase/lipase family protein [Pontibacter sp. G13]